MKQRLAYLVIFLSIILGCENKKIYDAQKIETELENINKAFVPDKRVAIAEAAVQQDDKSDSLSIVIKSNLQEVIDSTKDYVGQLPYPVSTSFSLLPDNKALEGKTDAVVNISVANIRSQPKHSAELATQATLGTPLKVLEKKGSWYRVQTPDKYISWVDEGGIIRFTPSEFNDWLKQDKIVVTEQIGYVYTEPDTKTQLVSDLTGGNVLKLIGEKNGFYEVEFPDKRQGYVPTEIAQVYKDWISNLGTSKESLVKVSKQMLGVPYLWGGTSFKGVDCSGFTKTIYFMNGMVIPRDASQQVHAGEEIDTSNGFEALEPGDLLFFGRKATKEQAEKVVHVAMWLGNNEFIHASGRVRINSFDPNAPNYNEYELNRFLRAKRFLNIPQELITRLEGTRLFYNTSN